MNGYLLDTHAFLWCLSEPEKLGKAASFVLSDMDSIVYVSSVTFWEIALKASLGRLSLVNCTPEDLPKIADRMGFIKLPLEAEEAAAFHRLPRQAHKDPFDRMLIWQAINRKMPLISKDSAFDVYRTLGLETVW